MVIALHATSEQTNVPVTKRATRNKKEIEIDRGTPFR